MANKTEADEPRSFDPTPAEVTRELQQGLGVGQRELDAQRDADQLPQIPLELDNDDDAVLNANNANRGGKPDRSSGPKTRAATKDQISRR